VHDDTGEEKKSADYLAHSEESLRATVENTPDVAIQWYDGQGRVLLWNRASETIFGWTADEAIGRTLDQLMLDAEGARSFMKALREIERTGNPAPPTEFEFHRRNDTLGFCLSTMFRIRRGSSNFCFVCMDVDITERKQAEELLREVQQWELRSREEFTRQLLEAQEQERQRLAAELHDSLGQILSIIKNNAYLALAQPGLAPTVIEHLKAISQSAAGALSEVRDLVHNLRPLQIEQRGVTDSIRELVEKVGQSMPIPLECCIENVDDAIQGPAATHLYRIVQEALNNVTKHSGATRASLSLERDIKCIRLRVSDNGTGFKIEPAAPRSGFGLRNIAERAQMLGGSLNIESAPAIGTTLKVEVPIADAESSAA
jgi:PAS domain S-box-containing protein